MKRFAMMIILLNSALALAVDPTIGGGPVGSGQVYADAPITGLGTSASHLSCAAATNLAPGCVSTGTQTFAGNKTLTGTVAASNLTGTNSGDVSIASVGSTPAAAGASLVGQVLTLQPASATLPGVVTAGTQSFGGAKTFGTTGTTALDLTVTQAASKVAISIPNTGGIAFNGDAVGTGVTAGSSVLNDDTSDFVYNYGSQARMKINHNSGEMVLLLGLDSPKVKFSGVLVFSGTVPTVSSGFGTSPSVTAGKATAFRLNVGTGGVATSGVIALPTASAGWNCDCEDLTTRSTTVFECRQTASTTATATIGNFNSSMASAAWVASDILKVNCVAY